MFRFSIQIFATYNKKIYDTLTLHVFVELLVIKELNTEILYAWWCEDRLGLANVELPIPNTLSTLWLFSWEKWSFNSYLDLVGT